MTIGFSFNAIGRAIWTLGSGGGLRTKPPINEHFAATKKIPEKGPGRNDFGPSERLPPATGNCPRLDGNCRESNGKKPVILAIGPWPLVVGPLAKTNTDDFSPLNRWGLANDC
jgi:hypothetical protein